MILYLDREVMMKSFLACLFFTVILACFVSFFMGKDARSSDAVPNEYIIKVKDGLKSTALDSFFHAKSNGLRKEVKRWSVLNMRYVKLDQSNLQSLQSSYGHLIEYIEPNIRFHTMDIADGIPSVPGTQWGLNSIEAKKAWEINQGTKNVIVAVIDTGIDCNHPALKSHCLPGWDFVNNKAIGADDQGHGTHCAGNIAANSSTAMGVAPYVTLLAAKFLDSNGSGSLEGAIDAIKYSVDQGANVLSNSWGGGGYTQSLRDVIKYAESKNVLFVAAAGNDYSDNDEEPSYPASYEEPNVISVAASDKNNTKAYFSNYGLKTVHLFAPGVNILSTMPGGKTGSMSGTSMATPFVAGSAALILSAYPNFNYQEIKNRLINNVIPYDTMVDYVISGGLLNVYKAIK
jgi:subtilisin family serine protease